MYSRKRLLLLGMSFYKVASVLPFVVPIIMTVKSYESFNMTFTQSPLRALKR